jgi:hypothetical protein
MRSYIVAVSMLLTSVPALATDSLSCNGETYSLDMSVGSDKIVDSATLTDKRTKLSTTYRLPEIENRELVWTASEGDFSENRLAIVLRGKDGQSFIVEARGRKGVLRHQKKTHKLDCNWER